MSDMLPPAPAPKVEDWRVEVEAMRQQWPGEEGDRSSGGRGELLETLEFGSQPQAFRVRGLLELPPLRMLSTAPRPALFGRPPPPPSPKSS